MLSYFSPEFAEKPNELVDLHCHALAGVDDGAADVPTMFAMMKRAYEDGIRHLCFTPHYNPAFFLPNNEKIEAAFRLASRYATKNFRGLHVYLGNEIYCRHQVLEALRCGQCRSLNKTKVLLLEFDPEIDFGTARSELQQVLSAGFQPLLAHVERYIWTYDRACAEELHNNGVLFQVNHATLMHGSSRTRALIRLLLEQNWIDVVADDCHNLTTKAPGLASGYQMIQKKYGADTANRLFKSNPLRLLTQTERE